MRQLTSVAGAVTDSYEYDDFGNEITRTGTTPNNYLYRGEQYDPDLSLYYLRARYYNPATGRFMSRDPQDGDPTIPATLHKYLYANGDPVDGYDPSGRVDLIETIKVWTKSVDNFLIAKKGLCLAVGIVSAAAWSAAGHTAGNISVTLNDVAALYAALSLICYHFL